MECHRTRDILYVKELLDHRRIDNTIIYIQLEKTIYQSGSNEWTVKVGFEYVAGEYANGGKIFRKRK